MKFYSVVVLWLVLSIVAINVQAESSENYAQDGKSLTKKLKVKVYYETLSASSMQFIRNPLYYSMIDNGWLKYTDLELIPYGKVGAWVDPVTNITSLYCEHGIIECELNALHVCIVENNSLEEQLKLFHCSMRNVSTNIDKCAADLNINIAKAKRCKATRSTPDILYKYGQDTNALGISTLPAIIIDGVFDELQQPGIRNKFDTIFCKRYKEKLGVKLGHSINCIEIY